MTERDFAIDVVRSLQQAGYRALWAGGCVRDELLGLTPQDYDVATDARPDDVKRLFRRSIGIGASFGVMEVIGPRDATGRHLTVEVATFRSDGQYIDGRRPESVTFSSPEEDARRRDFTINGMFFDPIALEPHDYVAGQVDLEAKVLRAIGDPAARFAEDKLRLLRAVRIAARFELEVEGETLRAAKRMAPAITVVSAERIAEELRKLLVHPHRARGVRLLSEFDLVPPLLPELAPTVGARWEHRQRVVELLEGPRWPETAAVSFPLALAALLHDLGRDVAGRIADRLKLSTAEKVRTMWLVGKHRFLADAPAMKLSPLKTILVHPAIGELLALHRAEARAGGQSLAPVEFCERMLRDTPREVLNPPEVLTGDDLIEMGLKPGPEFKRLLDAVREAQLEGSLRTKEEAFEFVRQRTGGVPDTGCR